MKIMIVRTERYRLYKRFGRIDFSRCRTEFFLVLFCFFFYLVWSQLIPYNDAPDEAMRFSIAEFIYKYGKLPFGNETEIMNPLWGQSYAYQPIFAYQIAALFMHLGHWAGLADDSLYLAARFANVLTGTGTVIVLLLIGRTAFGRRGSLLFACFIALLPEFAFVNSYVNNDGLAFFSAALIVLAWIRGIQDHWSIRSCVLLGFGTGLCALSYYNAYSWILCSLFLYLGCWISARDKNPRYWIGHGLAVLGVFSVLCGWWFVRSALLHNGDFLGLSSVNDLAEQKAMFGYKPSQKMTPQRAGLSLWQMFFKPYGQAGDLWIKSSIRSLFGVFSYNKLLMNQYYYPAVYLITLGGILPALWNWFSGKRSSKTDKTEILSECESTSRNLFFCMMILAALISFGISVYYSYTSDYQPQGRYFMTALIPMSFFWTWGMLRLGKLANRVRFGFSPGLCCVGFFGYCTFHALCVILGRAYLGI